MIGNPEWFQRRKYGGWGISPRTWQGWVYMALIILPYAIFQALPFWATSTRIVVTIVWLAILGLDVTHLMVVLRRDEREAKIEAIAERNAAWFMVLILVAGVVYEILSSALRGDLQVDWFLVVALFGGAFVKTVSNIVLERRPDVVQ